MNANKTKKITEDQLEFLTYLEEVQLLYVLFDENNCFAEEVKKWRNESPEFNLRYLKTINLSENQIKFYLSVFNSEHLINDIEFGRKNYHLYIPILRVMGLTSKQMVLILHTQ